MAERAKGGFRMDYTTCRDELLKTVRRLVKDKGINEFTPIEVITLMKQNGVSIRYKRTLDLNAVLMQIRTMRPYLMITGDWKEGNMN